MINDIFENIGLIALVFILIMILIGTIYYKGNKYPNSKWKKCANTLDTLYWNLLTAAGLIFMVEIIIIAYMAIKEFK